MQVGEAVDEVVFGDTVVDAIVEKRFLHNEHAFGSMRNSLLSLTPEYSI